MRKMRKMRSSLMLMFACFLSLSLGFLPTVAGWRATRSVQQQSIRSIPMSVNIGLQRHCTSSHPTRYFLISPDNPSMTLDNEESSLSSAEFSRRYGRTSPPTTVTTAADNTNTAAGNTAMPPAAKTISPSFTAFTGLNAAEGVESAVDMLNQAFSTMGISQGYGLSIILTTIAMKIATLPLSLPQIKSSARLQRLQAIQNRVMRSFADNDVKREELLALLAVSSSKVGNPLITSLLSLLQMPITMSVQTAFNNLLQHGKLNEPFLWIPNLQGPTYGKPANKRWEWLTSALSGHPSLGWKNTFAYLSLPTLQLVTQWYTQRVLTISSSAPPSRKISANMPLYAPSVMNDPQRLVQSITQLMPFLYTVQNVNAPSALLLHWIVNHIMTTAITVIARKQVEDEILPEEIQILEGFSSQPSPQSSSSSTATRRNTVDKSQSEKKNKALMNPLFENYSNKHKFDSTGSSTVTYMVDS